jgi:hypothetical protein
MNAIEIIKEFENVSEDSAPPYCTIAKCKEVFFIYLFIKGIKTIYK